MSSNSPAVFDFSNSFSGNLPPDAIQIPGLERFLAPGSSLYVHPSTGVVTSGLVMSAMEVASYWSEVIFKSSDPDDYSAANPFAVARLTYVAKTLEAIALQNNIKPSRICDFATGQGVLLPILQQIFRSSEICATEVSPELCNLANTQGFRCINTPLDVDYSFNQNIDTALLCWTLCNCIQPLKVLSNIASSLNEGGLLVIAESSRIMVPFRKSLHQLLNKIHPADTHPFYFSKNSLIALAALVNLKPLFVNRYYDSDVLLIIFKKESPNVVVPLPQADHTESVLSFWERYVQYTDFFEGISM